MPLSQLLFSIQGRVPRSTYWGYGITIFLISTVVQFVDLFVGSMFSEYSVGTLNLITTGICLIPGWVIAIKRGHDRDHSGWFLLLGLIPIVNIWIFIELAFLRGTDGSNQYGPDPLQGNIPRAPKEKEEYFGMSPAEIGLLVVLLIVLCILGSFLGNMILGNSSSIVSSEPVAVHQPTYTLAPSVTPSLTPPPRVTPTPMPGWNRFEFADGKAEIWLPESFQGGDTIAYQDIVIITLETYIDDEAFIESAKPLITNPNVLFFAFDTESIGSIRFVYVIAEQLPPDLIITMDDYLNAISDFATADDVRIVGRDIISLDYYSEAGVLTTEHKVPAGTDAHFYMALSTHTIRVDNTMWGIFFRTGRDEFAEYSSTIDTSIRTFYVNP